LRARECANVECPYCFFGMSLKGKRVGMCSMLKPFMDVGCPGRETAGKNVPGYRA